MIELKNASGINAIEKYTLPFPARRSFLRHSSVILPSFLLYHITVSLSLSLSIVAPFSLQNARFPAFLRVHVTDDRHLGSPNPICTIASRHF
jgi:hypothetical protein